jgi:hypothetical protein
MVLLHVSSVQGDSVACHKCCYLQSRFLSRTLPGLEFREQAVLLSRASPTLQEIAQALFPGPVIPSPPRYDHSVLSNICCLGSNKRQFSRQLQKLDFLHVLLTVRLNLNHAQILFPDPLASPGEGCIPSKQASPMKRSFLALNVTSYSHTTGLHGFKRLSGVLPPLRLRQRPTFPSLPTRKSLFIFCFFLSCQ